MIYKISLPIKISYIIDDIELRIHSVEELERLQDKYDVDLQYLIDEYEYKLEAEENYMRNDDYDDYDDDFSIINNNELLHCVIDDNLGDLMKKFNKEYKLSALDKESITKIFIAAQDDFKNNFKLREQPGQYEIISINISNYDVINSFFIIDVEVNRELSKDELNELKHIIDNKCTEEWGTQFEKNDFSDLIDEELMYVYVKCWDAENPIDFI
jgi:hypothetical protein